MFATALPDSEGDLVDLALQQTDVHVDMADIFGEGTSRALHGDDAGFDGDLNTLRDLKLLGGKNVAHLDRNGGVSTRRVR